jgi:hypothetical protein
MRATHGDIIPTNTESPVLDHPLLLKVVNTSLPELRGAKTQRGTIIAKNPKMCRIRTMPSISGSFLAR